MAAGLGAVGLLVGVVVVAVLYFAPTLVAHRRRHRNLVAVFALNLLLGWTFLGWVAALIWALVR